MKDDILLCTRGCRYLAGAIVAQALKDLEEPKRRDEALVFLNSEYCYEILAVLGDKTGILRSRIDSAIARVVDISRQELFQVQCYARNHTLIETADHFDISEDDLLFYAQWKGFTFKQ